MVVFSFVKVCMLIKVKKMIFWLNLVDNIDKNGFLCIGYIVQSVKKRKNDKKISKSC